MLVRVQERPALEVAKGEVEGITTGARTDMPAALEDSAPIAEDFVNDRVRAHRPGRTGIKCFRTQHGHDGRSSSG